MDEEEGRGKKGNDTNTRWVWGEGELRKYVIVSTLIFTLRQMKKILEDFEKRVKLSQI